MSCIPTARDCWILEPPVGELDVLPPAPPAPTLRGEGEGEGLAIGLGLAMADEEELFDGTKVVIGSASISDMK